MNNPERIQLRRKKGWKMPTNTVKVDRSTKWGNPFIVRKHGTRKECVEKFILLCAGNLILSDDNMDQQDFFRAVLHDDIHELKGKNLACWCNHSGPCHADVLLLIANSKEKPLHLKDEQINELLNK